MDGENHGKPYEQMDDLGGCFPLFSECHPYDYLSNDSRHLGPRGEAKNLFEAKKPTNFDPQNL